MQTTIYIRRDNEEFFNGLGKRKSAWLNDLMFLAQSGELDPWLAKLASDGGEPTYGVEPVKVVEQTKPAPAIPGVVKGSEFVPSRPDPETGYPCCLGKKPCRHWVWSESGEGWVNSLTGKIREE